MAPKGSKKASKKASNQVGSIVFDANQAYDEYFSQNEKRYGASANGAKYIIRRFAYMYDNDDDNDITNAIKAISASIKSGTDDKVVVKMFEELRELCMSVSESKPNTCLIKVNLAPVGKKKTAPKIGECGDVSVMPTAIVGDDYSPTYNISGFVRTVMAKPYIAGSNPSEDKKRDADAKQTNISISIGFQPSVSQLSNERTDKEKFVWCMSTFRSLLAQFILDIEGEKLFKATLDNASNSDAAAELITQWKAAGANCNTAESLFRKKKEVAVTFQKFSDTTADDEPTMPFTSFNVQIANAPIKWYASKSKVNLAKGRTGQVCKFEKFRENNALSAVIKIEIIRGSDEEEEFFETYRGMGYKINPKKVPMGKAYRIPLFVPISKNEVESGEILPAAEVMSENSLDGSEDPSEYIGMGRYPLKDELAQMVGSGSYLSVSLRGKGASHHAKGFTMGGRWPAAEVVIHDMIARKSGNSEANYEDVEDSDDDSDDEDSDDEEVVENDSDDDEEKVQEEDEDEEDEDEEDISEDEA